MITNPSVRALRYNPYSMELTEEEYDLTKMRSIRRSAIDQAMKATHWGLVLGTLGRQGNEAILERLKDILKKKGIQYDVVLISELSDATVGEFVIGRGNGLIVVVGSYEEYWLLGSDCLSPSVDRLGLWIHNSPHYMLWGFCRSRRGWMDGAVPYGLV